MRTFLQIFFRLLIPIILLSAVLLTLFFTYEYSFDQAMGLGVLYGFFSGTILSLVLSIALLIFRSGAKTLHSQPSHEKENMQNIKVPVHPVQRKEPSIEQTIRENIKKGLAQKLMLLMNKELIFELILSMTKKDVKFPIATHTVDQENIDLKIHGELI